MPGNPLGGSAVAINKMDISNNHHVIEVRCSVTYNGMSGLSSLLVWKLDMYF